MNCPPYVFHFHHGRSIRRRVGNLVAHHLSAATHRSLNFVTPGLVHNLQSRARQISAYHRDGPVIIEIDSLPTIPCLCQDVKNRADNFEDLAKLRKSTKTRIAGGEINSSWRDFVAMLDIGSLDVYQPDAVLAGGTYAGGISVVYWLIREIQQRNRESRDETQKLKYCPHTWTTGLGFALALQLVGVLPPAERSLLEYPLEGNWKPEYWARFIKGGFKPDQEGRIKIPDEPGMRAQYGPNYYAG